MASLFPSSPSQDQQAIVNNTIYTYDTTKGWLKSTNIIVTTITSPTYTIAGINQLIKCDCTSNAIAVILPTATTNNGRTITIKKTDVTSNLLTIIPNVSETINNDASLIIQYQNNSATLISDGSNWDIK